VVESPVELTSSPTAPWLFPHFCQRCWSPAGDYPPCWRPWGPEERDEEKVKDPDLLKVLVGFHLAQVAAPVHVHLGPSCTQSQCTRPILFNPRIMQRLMTFSMDCVHASPRSLADAIAVVACPS
jgi:hypothetical protein